MLAGVLYGRRDLRLETVSRPTLDVGQVLLHVRRAGICGSDVHYFVHGRCGAFVPTRPFILGHEFVAVVEQVGAKVVWPPVGQRVVVNPAASCGQCEACKSGRANLCSHVIMLGSASTTPPTDGAFAEYVVVPAHQCYALPESLEDSAGAMMEPLSVALHAIHRASGVAGARVLIFGGGPIGLLTALAARAFGASMIVMSEPLESRRTTSLTLGVDDTIDPGEEEFLEQAVTISDGGFDVVFEASGAPAAVQASLGTVRRGGKIVQIGTVGGTDVALPVNDLMVREMSLLGTFRYANEFPDAIRLVAAGRISVDGLVTGVFPLAEIPRALDSASTNREGLKVHVIID